MKLLWPNEWRGAPRSTTAQPTSKMRSWLELVPEDHPDHPYRHQQIGAWDTGGADDEDEDEDDESA